MRFQLNVPTACGVVLNGVLFRPQERKETDTVMIAITGIHGNFYSNPFYYNIGDTLNAHMPMAGENRLIFIEKTGHTYQMKHQKVADDILRQLQEWRNANAFCESESQLCRLT